VVSRRIRTASAVTLLAALGLSACGSGGGGGASADDLDASRAAVLDAARQDVPGIVDALGGEIQEAWGEYRSGGDGIIDRRRYQVTVVVTGSDADAGAIVAALEDAGWSDVEDTTPGGISGVRGDLGIGSTDPGGPDLRVSVRGPYLEVADGVPRDSARHPVDLG
jgi:hypothetical protein